MANLEGIKEAKQLAQFHFTACFAFSLPAQSWWQKYVPDHRRQTRIWKEFLQSLCTLLSWAKPQMSTYCARYQHVFTFIISAAKDTALIYHLLQVEGRGLCTTASLWNALLMVILKANAVCSAWVLLNSSQSSSLLSLVYQDKLCSLYCPATQQLKTQMQPIEETEDSTNRLNP